MLSNRRGKIHRRSLLAVGASFAAMLSFPRHSDASEAESFVRPPANAHRNPDRNEGTSGNQPPDIPDLKAVSANRQVASIRYVNKTYHVTTAAGAEIVFQEFDLRFKTDMTDRGPAQGRPVLLPASMRTDRALIVFATPYEISAFMERGVQRQTSS
ncbi:MAG: hypothetical protein ABI407_15010 [Bradyrhizobium sp.]